MWALARGGHEGRLTETVIDSTQGTNPQLLDFASWPAIAGDHSCSPADMLNTILTSDWILEVADINARLRIDLADSADRNARVNALRRSDLRLQNADADYATRAGSSKVHFLMSLPHVLADAHSYELACTKGGVELNAVGAYAWYHHSALVKATRLSADVLTNADRSSLAISALADEAFAVHFLEDMFAAGHVAGTWGDASQRKGTHDYYNENGLKTSTWNGRNIVLTGDAWMREEDAERAAVAVQRSIEQILDAGDGRHSAMVSRTEEKTLTPDSLDVCNNAVMPSRDADPHFETMLEPVFLLTPVPGLAYGLGELPRFRAELGMFVGFSPALRGSILASGYGKDQTTAGVSGGIETSVRLGLGLDGVLNEAGDGLVFLDLGWRQDGSSSIGLVEAPGIANYGSLLAAIPGRSSFSARMRMPFYLVPGDLLLVAPFLLFTSPETLLKMSVKASNGGLIPWQSGLATSLGRFQFVLGREIGVYLFGRTKERDAMFGFGQKANGSTGLLLLSYRATQVEFPILEYRPFRQFSIDQSSGIMVQFYGGIDIPHTVETLEPDAGVPPPELKTIWYLGARLVFNWRHYF
jgi:hypothetical protein